jgi:MFS family permease
VNKEIMTIKHSETKARPAIFAWLGLAVVYSGLLGVGLVFHFVPPVLPVVIRDMGLTHGQAGLFMSLFALPGIILSIPGGMLVDRFGERVVGGTGLLVMGTATLLLSTAENFQMMLLARTLSGVGAQVAVVSLQSLVIRLFRGRPLGVPMGISGSAVPLGIIIALNISGPLSESSGWREVALRVGLTTTAISLVFFIAGYLILKGGREVLDSTQANSRPSSFFGVGFKAIFFAGIVWFFVNGAMTAFMTFAPDYYHHSGFNIQQRGLLTSIPMWVSALLGPFVGLLADRRGGKAALMGGGCGLMALGLAFVPVAGFPPVIIGVALGLAMAFIVTPLLSLPGEIVDPSRSGRAFGVLSTLANIGIFIIPPTAGMVRDYSGGYLWPFLMMAALAGSGVAAAEALRRGKFVRGFHFPS